MRLRHLAVRGFRNLSDLACELPAAGVGHAVLVAAGAAAMVALLTVVPAVHELRTTPRNTNPPVLFRMRSERP